MIITDSLENLEVKEIRVFNYFKLEQELGTFERYKRFDGAECEEVTRIEVIDGMEVIDRGWEIIGTNKIVEYQWTDPT